MYRTLAIAACIGSAGCGNSSATTTHEGEYVPASETAEVEVLSRMKALAYYPCETCHRHADEGQGTVANSHATIRVQHMPNASCVTCHDKDQPGKLKLASGMLVDLEKSYELCQQCHARQVSDWSVGIHGKQVGNWQTKIQRYACTTCHDAHAPEFGTMSSKPPPPFPALGIPKESH